MTSIAAESPVHIPTASMPIVRITLPERFDVHEIADFTAEVAGATALACVLLVDASAIRYMDRSGMDTLMETRLRCIDRKGEMVLLNPSLAARITLELSGRYEALNPADADALAAQTAGLAA
ncbi:STAS domain-containing protein [Mycolicibacterium sp. 3033]|nr:STAS domain-containing protein [Mycolicibacterium aurantiacum]